MSKSYASLLLVIIVSVSVIVGLQALFPMRPSALGLLLALAGILTLAMKFALSDLLSSSGFDQEKAAVDLTLTLCSTLFAMAVVQQDDARHVIFPAIVMLVDGATSLPTPGRAAVLMWAAFGFSVLLLIASLMVLMRLQKMEVQVAGMAPATLQKGVMALMRLFILGSFVTSYALYLITILFKD